MYLNLSLLKLVVSFIIEEPKSLKRQLLQATLGTHMDRVLQSGSVQIRFWWQRSSTTVVATAGASRDTPWILC